MLKSAALAAAATTLAAWVAGCDGTTEPLPSAGPPAAPPAEVRVTPISATSITGTVGTEVQPPPAVRATDEDDRPLAGVPITFRVVSGGGTIAGRTVTTGADGSAVLAKWTLGRTAGTQTLRAGAAGRTDVMFTALATAGPLDHLTAWSGNDQTAGIGELLPQPLTVRAEDAFGNPVAGIPIGFTVIAGGGSIDPGPIASGPAGIAASKPWALGGEPGIQQVSAASGPAQVVFQAFAIAPPSDLKGQIAFVSLAEASPDIAVMNADGSGYTRLAHAGRDGQPAWSPDGRRIAFVTEDDDGESHIHVMAANGTNVTRLTDGPSDRDPAWAPDGSAIAFSSLRDAGSAIVSLGTVDGSVAILADEAGYEGQPSWSPDGRQLAFVSDQALYDFVLDIYSQQADGTGQKRMTGAVATLSGSSYYLHPAWSPDGSMIAFVTGESLGYGGTGFSVALMSADGVFLRQLAHAGTLAWNELPDPGSLAWAPDGKGVAYSSIDAAGVRSVKYVSLDGSRRGTLVSHAQDPTWRR